MNEKEAVSDTLSQCNAIITKLTYSIEHCNNQNLRDTFAAFRNQFENLHWEIYLIAKQKGYYVPAAPAGAADIEAVKTSLSGS